MANREITIEQIEQALSRGRDYISFNDQMFNDIVDVLIRENKVDLRDSRQSTPLIIASYKGYKDIVRKLLDAGSDVNAYDSNIFTPLSRALRNFMIDNRFVFLQEDMTDNIDIVKMLLDKGAKLTHIENDGKTPLMTLIENYEDNDYYNTTIKFILDNLATYIENNDTIAWIVFTAYDILVGKATSQGENPANLFEDELFRDIQQLFINEDTGAMKKYGVKYREPESIVKYIINYKQEKERQESTQNRNIEDKVFAIVDYFETYENAPNITQQVQQQAQQQAQQAQQEAQQQARQEARQEARQVYKEINEEIMKNPPAKIDISKTVSFYDPIMMSDEEIHIESYLSEDRGNIVIVYDNDKYFFTTRDSINHQKKDATLYPCKTGLDEFRMRIDPQLVVSELPLYDLKKVGFLSGYPCIMNKLFGNPDAQLFSLVNLDLNYPSFVSQAFLNEEPDSAVSGLHCQAGQESRLSFLDIAVPSLNGESGKRKPERATEEEFDRGESFEYNRQHGYDGRDQRDDELIGEDESENQNPSTEGGSRKRKGRRKQLKTKKYIKRHKSKRRTRSRRRRHRTRRTKH